MCENNPIAGNKIIITISVLMFKHFCHGNAAIYDLYGGKSENRVSIIFFLIPMAGIQHKTL